MGLFEDLVTKNADQVDGYSNVLNDEVLVVKSADEHFDTLRQGQDNEEAEGGIGAPSSQRSAVGDVCGIDALGCSGAAEEDVGDEDGNPCKQTYGTRQCWPFYSSIEADSPKTVTTFVR